MSYLFVISLALLFLALITIYVLLVRYQLSIDSLKKENADKLLVIEMLLKDNLTTNPINYEKRK